MPEENALATIHHNLKTYFNLEELHTFCLELGVDPEKLPVRTLSKDELVRELLRYLVQRSRLEVLLSLGSQWRPRLDWPMPTSQDILLWQDIAGEINWAEVEQTYLNLAAKEWSSLQTESGSSFPLTAVYVMLQALPSRRPASSTDRPDLAPTGPRLEHTNLPPGGMLPSTEKEQKRERQPDPLPQPEPLSQVLRENQHLVILGEPGAGKSTTLQFIGRFFATRESTSQENLVPDEARIPALIPLQVYKDMLVRERIEDVLALLLKRWSDLTETEALGRVQTWRDRGQLVLLLDGLDEVPEEERPKVVQAIRIFQSRGRNCRVILTSRTVGYRQELGQPFKEFVLKPFDTTDSVPYVANWLAVLQPEDHPEPDLETAENLVRQMTQQAGLRRVLDNPLLLRLAVETFVQTGDLLESRASLYRQYVEQVARRNAERRGAAAADLVQAMPALETIAWAMHTRRTHRLSDLEQLLNGAGLAYPRSLLDLLREKMGLLVYYGTGPEQEAYFSHTTFQEYFVALRLKSRWTEDEAAAWRFLNPRLHHPLWHEPLLLLAGLLEARSAGRLVERVLGAGSLYERDLHRDLHLAAELVANNDQIPGEIVEVVLSKARWLISGRRDLSLFVVLLATFFLGFIIPIPLLGWYAIPLLIIWLALWWWGLVKGKRRLAGLLWFPARLIGGSGEAERKKAIDALVFLGSRSVPALVTLVQDESYIMTDVREKAVRALGDIGDKTAVPTLIQTLLDGKEKKVRAEAATVLAQFRDDRVMPALIEAMQDEEEWVQQAAAQALGQIGDEAAFGALLEALRDKKKAVREGAVLALEQFNQEKDVYLMLEVFENAGKVVRAGIIQALGQVGHKATLPLLLRALADKNWKVRENAAIALGKVGAEEAVPVLVDALQERQRYDRLSVLKALGEMRVEAAVPGIVAMVTELDNPDQPYYFKSWEAQTLTTAVRALGQIGRGTAVYALLEGLGTWSLVSKREAAEALGKIGDAVAVPALLEAAAGNLGRAENNQDYLRESRDREQVQIAAIVALGKIGDRAAVPLLIEKIRVPNLTGSVAEALGKIGDEAAIPPLIQAAKTWVLWKKLDIYTALARLGAPEALLPLLNILLKEQVRMYGDPPGERQVIEATRVLVSQLQDSEDLALAHKIARRVWWGLVGEEELIYKLFSDVVEHITLLQVKALPD